MTDCYKCGNKVEPAIQEFFDEVEDQMAKYAKNDSPFKPECGDCLAEHHNIDVAIETKHLIH